MIVGALACDASGIVAALVSPAIAGGGELVMSDAGKLAVGAWPVTETNGIAKAVVATMNSINPLRIKAWYWKTDRLSRTQPKFPAASRV